MTTSRRIRLATVEDLPVLLPLFRDYQAHYDMLTAATEDQTAAFWRDFLSDPRGGFVLLALRDETVVGFASVYLTVSGLIAERLAHLGDLYVAPAERRRGIATALFNEVSAQSAQRGIKRVRWLSLSSNTELNAWYAQLVPPAGTFQLFLRPTGIRSTRV